MGPLYIRNWRSLEKKLELATFGPIEERIPGPPKQKPPDRRDVLSRDSKLLEQRDWIILVGPMPRHPEKCCENLLGPELATLQ